MAKKSFISASHVKRAKRIAAFGAGAGLVSPGAGAWVNELGIAQIDAIASAVFGAIVVLVSLVAALLITYAGKGEVSDADFDSHMNAAIENIKSTKKEEK